MMTTDQKQILNWMWLRQVVTAYLKPPPNGKISSEPEADFESKWIPKSAVATASLSHESDVRMNLSHLRSLSLLTLLTNRRRAKEKLCATTKLSQLSWTQH